MFSVTTKPSFTFAALALAFLTSFRDQYKIDLTPEIIDEFVKSLPERIQQKTEKLLQTDDSLSEDLSLITRLAGLADK